MQPPSGGCVLKQYLKCLLLWCQSAATFGWLCVETRQWEWAMAACIAATFGWLCVETSFFTGALRFGAAATFGWLCVETLQPRNKNQNTNRSHLRVAVCWNICIDFMWNDFFGSHLRVAVCWNFKHCSCHIAILSSHLRVAVCWNLFNC